jgi:DNA-binding GntR family transcriptional regulator
MSETAKAAPILVSPPSPLTALAAAEGPEENASSLLHAHVYKELRRRLITGKMTPGVGLSTRNLAAELSVSQMPVRDALSRLAAEGAVEIRSKRKVMIPAMTATRFDDLLQCRLQLEPLSARLAFPFIDGERLEMLRRIDDRMTEALRSGDVNAYMEGNFAFHFTIYRAHNRRTMNQLIETLWLQFGPYMRVVYGRVGTVNMIDQHQVALKAIEDRDAEALEKSISMDISDGMGLIGRNGLPVD